VYRFGGIKGLQLAFNINSGSQKLGYETSLPTAQELQGCAPRLWPMERLIIVEHNLPAVQSLFFRLKDGMSTPNAQYRFMNPSLG
jgi:hypothetical protein